MSRGGRNRPGAVASRCRDALCGTLTILISLATVCCREHDRRQAVLVVAPHPDDDVITCAGIVRRSLARGDDVRVVYMTNGDLGGVARGLQRQDEAVEAMVDHLGMRERDLIFLGYPDGHLARLLEDHPADTDRFVTDQGQSSTYGRRGYGGTDYHAHRFGRSATYNAANAVTDLSEIVKEFRPDHIFTTAEFDQHRDHAATHAMLRRALDRVRQVDPGFAPIVHKTVVWPDPGFRSDWPFVSAPRKPFDPPPSLAEITSLKWADRESIDVPLELQTPDLQSNPKHRAVEKHRSEGGSAGQLGKFVRKDEVFWLDEFPDGSRPPLASAGPDLRLQAGAEGVLDATGSRGADLEFRWRQSEGPPVVLHGGRTPRPRFRAPSGHDRDIRLMFELTVGNDVATSFPDAVAVHVVWNRPTGRNLAGSASTRASSANPNGRQAAEAAVDGRISGWPASPDSEWATDGERAGAWLRLEWPEPVQVEWVLLNDRPNFDDQILEATLRTSDGLTRVIGALDNGGADVGIHLGKREVTGLSLHIDRTSARTVNIGLAEIRVLAPGQRTDRGRGR